MRAQVRRRFRKGCVADMKFKVAVLGGGESIFPFSQIGADVFEAEGGIALSKQVSRLVKDGYALFFISEDSLVKNTEILDAYDKHPTVTVIPIPGLESEDGFGVDRIRKRIERALGQSIL